MDRFTNSDFDVILMDIRMPMMDGLTAARAIRAIERERGSAPVPIVALTANASTQDIEASRNAGCNAHLSKPISKAKVLSCIEEYAGPTTPPEVRAARTLGAIRIEMPRGLESIVPEYLVGRRKEVSQMIERLAVSDFEAIAVLAHNLKGSGAAYGFPELTRIGADMEASAEQASVAAVGKQLSELKDYLDRVEIFSV